MLDVSSAVLETLISRHALTILFLVLAIVMYGAGLALPATGLLIVGVVFEGTFWWRLLKPGKPSNRS
ncbi:MAG: hypothetical protein AAF385_04055 [Pseudomonadota bacterium]